MAHRATSKRLPTIQINDTTIIAAPNETVLQAALRNGVEFPNSCRVGGCGSCKCRLADGSVKELTETGYLLTGEELDQGYILACQSVATTDVRIEVPLAARSPRGTAGIVIAQEKLTHDITRIEIALEEALSFEPGQFANVSVEGLTGVTRSYSFAAPPTTDRTVTFFVRRVPGGKLSSLINDEPLVGRSARVDGPHGTFTLRESEAPLLMVAGGSGLAPILAILQAQARSGCARSVTLLFGARAVRDLYALDEIAAIAKQWKGEFKFVPVLSDAASDGQWTGERGLVTEKIAALIEPGAHAYLCGPPAMIDSAASVLRARGVEHVHADRFTTLADTVANEQKIPPQNQASSDDEGALTKVLHYAKFFSFHAVGLLALVALVAGGGYITAGLLSVLALYMIGDAVLGDDTSTPTYRYPAVLTAQLWLALPLLAAIVFASVWSVATKDVLNFGAWIHSLTGFDALAARAATGFGHHVSAWILTGLMIGMVGTITAHELTHRTWDPVSMFIGRWLLAFSFDTTFAIEHVYGHHRYVSTVEDPATAPRGRNVYFHVIASTIKGNVSAWRIEAARLKKKRLAVFSLHNAFIRGHLMSVALVALVFALAGPAAAGYFILCALWGKSLLEIVNYMEHYGMVRDPATPVQPRHSWNTNRRVSSWTMFNLTRHSHHHAQGEVPYHELRPYPDAPMMINGYLTTLVVAMIPPLWHKLMTPKVLEWDRAFASSEERELAARANGESGIAALEARA